jgi:hypothetical protein
MSVPLPSSTPRKAQPKGCLKIYVKVYLLWALLSLLSWQKGVKLLQRLSSMPPRPKVRVIAAMMMVDV